MRHNFSEITYDLALIDKPVDTPSSVESSALTLVQQRRLDFVANKVRSLSPKAPGRTNLAERCIDTGDARPIK